MPSCGHNPLRQTSSNTAFLIGLVALVAAVIAAPVSGQPRGVRVDTEWVFESDAAHAGTTIHAALRVKVHDNFHVQSNKPDDEFLIPTTRTLAPLESFSVREIVYPEPVTFEAPYSEDPMPVFEHEFVIGVAIDVGPDVVPGEYSVTSTLYYQACNDKVCLMPTSKDVASVLRVVPVSVEIAKAQSPRFDGIVFTGVAGSGVSPARHAPEIRIPTASEDDCDVIAELENFTILGTTGGYLRTADFLAFIDAAETGAVPHSLLEGKALLVIVPLLILAGLAGIALLPARSRGMVRVKYASGGVLLGVAASFGYFTWKSYDRTLSAVQPRAEGAWTASICEGLAAARAENRLVLIDFWATWSKCCLEMYKTTLQDDDVVARLADYVKIKFQAENLGASPARQMFERFEAIGLPTYVILQPRPGAESVE